MNNDEAKENASKGGANITPDTNDYAIYTHIGTDIGLVYTEDKESAAAAYVKDEAGNITQISPHNSKGEWEFYSYNKATGRTVRFDMERVVRAIEEITGEQFLEETYD